MNKLLIAGLLLLVVIIVYLCFRKTKEMFSGSRVVENMANPYDSNNAINTDQELSSIVYENEIGGFSTISANELKEATTQAIQQGHTEVCNKNLVISKNTSSVMISYTYNGAQKEISLTNLKIANLTAEKNKVAVCPKIGTNQQPTDTLKNMQNVQTLQQLEEIEDNDGVIYNEGARKKQAPQNYSTDTGITKPATQEEINKQAVTLKELTEQQQDAIKKQQDTEPRRPISPETSFAINQQNQSGENKIEQQMERAPPTQ
jgi:hypothetical protein